MVRHNLVDRFHLDHPEREMWMWLDNSPSVHTTSYLDRRVRRADTDFVTCPLFNYGAWLVKFSLQLANRPSLVDYWKFNTSLLEIQDFRDWLVQCISGGSYWE